MTNAEKLTNVLIEQLSNTSRPVEDYYRDLLAARQTIQEALDCADSDGIDLGDL